MLLFLLCERLFYNWYAKITATQQRPSLSINRNCIFMTVSCRESYWPQMHFHLFRGETMQELTDFVVVHSLPLAARPSHTVFPGLWTLSSSFHVLQAAPHPFKNLQGFSVSTGQRPLDKAWIPAGRSVAAIWYTESNNLRPCKKTGHEHLKLYVCIMAFCRAEADNSALGIIHVTWRETTRKIPLLHQAPKRMTKHIFVYRSAGLSLTPEGISLTFIFFIFCFWLTCKSHRERFLFCTMPGATTYWVNPASFVYITSLLIAVTHDAV